MNDSTKVILIILTLLSIGLPVLAFAEHDYFEPQWLWDSPPVVCLVDIPPEDKYLVLRAVTAWERALEDYNGGVGFAYHILVVESGEMAECNGYLHYSKEFKPNPTTGIVPIGLASCHESGLCFLKINRAHASWYDTIVHEMGHFLGLGHRLPYENKGIVNVFMSDDIMMPVAKDNTYITKESLDALIYFNTLEDKVYNYTIPHTNDWKK